MHRALPVLPLLFLALACGRAAPMSVTAAGDRWQPELQTCPSGFTTRPGLSVSAATMTGDTLTLTVQHGGGCKTHEYGLCWGQTFLESNPPQAQLQVLHQDNGDTCEALVSNTVTFDVTALKSAYQAGYQQQSGTVLLRLGSTGTRYDF